MTSSLLELAWKSLLGAGLTLLLIRILRKRSASERSLVAFIGIAGLVMLPLATLLLPRMEVSALPAVPSLDAPQISAATPAFPGPTTTATPLPAINGYETAEWIYLTVAILFAAGLLLSLIRLQVIRSRAELICDPDWLAAMVRAQKRIGCKSGTALLVSEDLDSPLSWGLLRPIIILDLEAARRRDVAEAIIVHELAHVVRMDWLRLIVGRIAIAAFWFNPFVWLLVRASHHYCEEAADDAVLATKIKKHDYADLLLTTARHANRSAVLAANGVAPGRSSLARRISSVLDGSRPRGQVTLAWALGALATAFMFNGLLAAAVPVPETIRTIAVEGAGNRAAVALDRIGSPATTTVARALRNRDWAGRRVEGNTAITEYGAVTPLLFATQDPDPRVRRIAVWALSEVRPAPAPQAAGRLAILLSDSSPSVRAQAVRALGDFEAVKYSADIARLLRDPAAEVRVNAAHALGDLQQPSTRLALNAAAADPDVQVRSEVAWAAAQVAEAEKILARPSG